MIVFILCNLLCVTAVASDAYIFAHALKGAVRLSDYRVFVFVTESVNITVFVNLLVSANLTFLSRISSFGASRRNYNIFICVVCEFRVVVLVTFTAMDAGVKCIASLCAGGGNNLAFVCVFQFVCLGFVNGTAYVTSALPDARFTASRFFDYITERQLTSLFSPRFVYGYNFVVAVGCSVGCNLVPRINDVACLS